MGHIKVSQKMTQSDLSGESCVIGMSDGSATTPLLLSVLLFNFVSVLLFGSMWRAAMLLLGECDSGYAVNLTQFMQYHNYPKPQFNVFFVFFFRSLVKNPF